MGKTNNTIRFNGMQYDAQTGRPIIHSLDGMLGSPVQPAPAPRPAVTRPASRLTMQDVTRLTGSHTQRPVEPSHTLMRRAVKRPAGSAHRPKPTQHLKPDIVPLAPKPAIAQPLNAQRLKRAQQTPRSQAIQRFSASQFRPTAAAAELTQAPPTVLTPPVEAAPVPPPILGRPTKLKAHPQPPTPPHAAQPKLAAKRTPKRRLHGKRLVMAGAGFVSLALIAFVALQNLTNVKLQLASAKAGFNASAPTYQPAGFHVSSVQYGNGTVTIKYVDGQRVFTLIEKSSSWSSQDLLNNFVNSASTTYETATGGGRVMYLYGNGNATWVQDGVWYQVNSSGALSSQQLMRLASSL